MKYQSRLKQIGFISSNIMLIMLLLALSGTIAWLLLSESKTDTGIDKTTLESTSSVEEAINNTENSFVIVNADIFDGETLLNETSVIVRNGLITEVGEIDSLPAELPVIDVTGKTLLPGLFDAHTHIFGSARHDALRFGVTTSIDLFSDVRQIKGYQRQRLAIEAQEVADVWSAGTLVTAAGGHGTQYGFAIPTLDTVEQADAFIGDRQAEGSDFIKLVLEDGSSYDFSLDTLDEPRLRAAISAAKARHLLTVVHVSTLDNAKLALRSGADGLAHLFADQVVDDEFIDLAKRSGAFVIPTIAIIASVANAGDIEQWLLDPNVKPWVSAEQNDSLRATFPSTQVEGISNALESLKRLNTAGVLILAGSDAPNPGTAHGIGLHQELRWLVRAGLSPQQALQAATSNVADAFGIKGRGRIKVGQRADLLLLNGQVVDNINNSLAIDHIWKNGYIVSRLAADSLVKSDFEWPEALGLLEDFETDINQATVWQVTTDKIAGGHSQAMMQQVVDADNRALEVSGQVLPGSPFPWSGVITFTAERPMESVNAESISRLQFRVRGQAGRYQFMVFSGAQSNAIPAMQMFEVTPTWEVIDIEINTMRGVQLDQLRAFAWTMTDVNTEFSFELDDIRIE